MTEETKRIQAKVKERQNINKEKLRNQVQQETNPSANKTNT